MRQIAVTEMRIGRCARRLKPPEEGEGNLGPRERTGSPKAAVQPSSLYVQPVRLILFAPLVSTSTVPSAVIFG